MTGKKTRYLASLTILLVIMASFVSCSDSPTAGTIAGVNEDGSLLIKDNSGNSYTIVPYTTPDTVNYANVLSYGAVGDGENDDTYAIRDAVSALQNGGVLYIPAGSYKITAPITFEKSNIIIEGDGNNSALNFTYLGTDTGKSEPLSVLRFSKGTDNVQIRNLSLSYFPSGDSSENVYGIYLDACKNVQIDSIKVSGFTASGISIAKESAEYAEIVSITSSTVEDNSNAGIEIGYVKAADVSECNIYKNGMGILVSSDATPEDIRIFGNRIVNNLTSGVKAESGDSVIVSNNTVKANGACGIFAEGSKLRSVIISNNFITDMTGSESASAICTGITEKLDERSLFIVTGNIIKNFTPGGSDSYGIHVTANGFSTVNVSDNLFEGDTLMNAIFIGDSSDTESKTDVSVIGNTLKAASVKDSGIFADGVRKLTVSRNKLFLDSISGKAFVSLKTTADVNYISSENMMNTASDDIEAMIIDGQTENTIIMSANDMLNGEILYKE